jgi:hypothetical protein
MNICNLCAVVGINKLIYVKQLYGICIILNIKKIANLLGQLCLPLTNSYTSIQ